MPKHEKGTPKEIANRSKTRGLQKLRWYCEMCQKQCRDQNGFKCHLTSEAHQRQLLLFAENEKRYISEFSGEFLRNFMGILKSQFGTRRVRANEVYQAYIKDKNHIHMNSTMWHSLTGLVQWLGNKGKCKIDQNEKGWYIQYIDYEEENRKQDEQKRVKQEIDDEMKQQELIDAQLARAKEVHGEQDYTEGTELVRNEDEKIALELNLNKKQSLETLQKPVAVLGESVFAKSKVKKEERDSRSRSRSRSPHSRWNTKSRDYDGHSSNRPSTSKHDDRSTKKSALDEIREQEERRKEKKNRKDYWLCPGIVVKVVTKKLGEDYYKAKGVVRELVDDYTAKVKIDDVTIKLDQAHVETVIPQVGREMMIVNGAYRGTKATLLKIDEKAYSIALKLSSGICKGREITVPYEDASKLAV
ncbi:unnamed protein product, partial [Mesorhabditis belari]|uniref:DNA/RNA-binding protein Kin17 WH-like domain-containing protein n=1 Tax=Mesorhabditis belari TaxID=2138241 RepID=A0AAF3E8M6_9BILA